MSLSSSSKIDIRKVRLAAPGGGIHTAKKVKKTRTTQAGRNFALKSGVPIQKEND